jgi:enhancing lycopene biosynthesis protein 2
VAVVLSGCGVYDGSEIHEAAACLAAITRHNAEPVVFAPKMDQVSFRSLLSPLDYSTSLRPKVLLNERKSANKRIVRKLCNLV